MFFLSALAIPAEASWPRPWQRHYWGDLVEAFSAGTYPLGHITPYTLQALSEQAISTDRALFQRVFDIPFDRIQLIVCLTGDSFEHLIPRSFSGEIIRWHVRDPYGQALSVFRQTLDTTEWLIRTKLPGWLDLDPTSGKVPDPPG